MSWQHQLKAVVPMSGIYRISPCRPRPGGSVNPRFIQLWVIPPKSDRLTVGRMSLLWIYIIKIFIMKIERNCLVKPYLERYENVIVNVLRDVP